MALGKQEKPLRVAVLLTYEAQMLDLAGIDLFGMMSKEYLATALPRPISENGLDVKIWYVGKHVPKQGSSPAPEGTMSGAVEDGFQSLTAQAKIKTTATLIDPEVQPGQIDVVLIPGPDPAHVHERGTLDFVRTHADHGTTVLVVCTGCYVAAEAGILDGLSASGPRALVPSLRKKYPAVTWDDQRRFVKNVPKKGALARGEVWTSGMHVLVSVMLLVNVRNF